MTAAARFDPTPTAAEIAEWLQILLGLFGSGYTTDPDSLRVREMESWAYLFAWCDNVLTQVGRERFAQTALDTIDEHEASLRLPNDSGITDEARIARVLALRSMRGTNEASLARVLAALGSLGPGELRGVIASEMTPELGLETFHALTSVLQVSAADLAEPRIKQALSLAMDRGLDVSRFGPNHAKGSRILASAIGAAWESSTALDGNPQVFGAVAIDRSGDATAETAPRWTSHLRTFGPLSVIHLDDMRRVVRALCLQPSLDDVPSPTMAGDLKCLASISIAAGTNVLVEDTGVWTDRLMLFTGQASTSVDIRPGGAAEDGDGARITPGMLYTSTGGVGNVATLIANVEIYADAVTGLRIRNTGGTTAYVNVFAWATSKASGGSSIRDPFGLAADTVTNLDASTWNTFVEFLGTKRGAAADAWAAGELRGLVHRFALSPPMTIPGIGAVAQEFVIDSTIDWRDRFVVASVGGFDISAGGLKFPGGENQDTGAAIDLNVPANTYGQFLFGWLGTGHAAAQTAAGQWDVALTAPGAPHLYARSTTGELVLALYSAAGPAGFQDTFTVNVIGSFALGVKTTPSAAAPAIPTATAGAAMRPAQLNVPQDYAITDYARALETASADLLTVPMGLDVYGAPPIGRVQLAQRDRTTGYVQDAAVPLIRRERTDGAVSSWGFNSFGATTHFVLDATQDWRDRWISRVGTTSIGTNANRGFYSGPGMTPAAVAAEPASGYYARINTTSDLFLYADSVTGALTMYVGSVGADVYSIIIGSPHLGGRSVFVDGRASSRPPYEIGNLFHWTTARRSVMTGSTARVVKRTEARAGVVHTASQINGFQSGGLPAVGFTNGTTTYPWVGSRPGAPAALRVRSEDDAVWVMNLTAGTWAFLSQGPMTLAFAFAMVDIERPYPPRANIGGGTAVLLAHMFECYDSANNESGIKISIDVENHTFVFTREQQAASVFTRNVLTSKTKIRDGLPHYAVIRQSTTAVELYIDGRLEVTATPVTITQPNTRQPRLSSTFYSYQSQGGFLPQAGFDLFELPMFDAALSDAQLIQLHAYLKSTYRRNLP